MSKNKNPFSVKLVNPKDEKNTEVFKDFQSFWGNCYAEAFPDEKEQEPWEEIEGRVVSGENAKPPTYAVLGYFEGKPVAGMIADWYPNCKSLEVIYLAVAKGLRRKAGSEENPHFGRNMLLMGLEELKKKLPDIARVYLETENPLLSDNTPIDPVQRLRFFDACGARRVMIDYQQPPLKEGGDWAENLFLMTLPEFSANEKSIPVQELKNFLQAFYDELKPKQDEAPDKEAVLAEMDRRLAVIFDQIDRVAIGVKELDEHGKETDKVINRVPLDRLLEQPSYAITDFSVATHYNLGPLTEEKAQRLLSTGDNTFDSYECDLFKYIYQQESERPFRTFHHRLLENVPEDTGDKVTLHLQLPSFYHYSSEGRDCYRIRKSQEALAVDISLNYSILTKRTTRDIRNTIAGKSESWVEKRSKHRTGVKRCEYMGHVVITPSASTFTELDLIQLLAYLKIGSSQERYESKPMQVRYSAYCDGKAVPFEELICHYFGFEAERSKELFSEPMGSGATELDMGAIKPTAPTKDGKDEQWFKTFQEFRDQITSLTVNPAKHRWNKVFCGLLLGIFDHIRMAGHEIVETVRPIAEWTDSFMLLSRGHLLKIVLAEEDKEEDDDQEEDVRKENQLITPYMLIPSAALAYNQNLLDYVEDSLKLLDDPSSTAFERFFRKIFMSYYRSYTFEHVFLQKIIHSLDEEYHENIFQYSSETAILHHGTAHRGYAMRMKQVKSLLERGRSHRDECRDKYTGGIDTLQNILLFALAGLQVTTAIADIETEEGLKLSTFMPSIVMVILVLLVGGFIYLNKRRM